ncbi:MAG: ABC transporter ATP-binding protein [Parvibaculales bacterium]
MSDSLLETVDLTGGYQGTAVIHNCSVTVAKGEIVVIMGGSGSGKSTFLRHLIGLKKPMSGSVLLGGKNVYEIPTFERFKLLKSIGVAFQSGALLSSLSIEDNVALPLREHTNLDEEMVGIVTRMKLDQVDLLGKEKLLPGELSGGMLKRAAVARALALDPKLLFFDEPSAGLDPAIAASLDELIIKIKEALNISIVVVTHELDSAFKIADRIVMLDRGHIIFDGSVPDIKASKNERIQNLINRVAEKEEFDPEQHLLRLVGADHE